MSPARCMPPVPISTGSPPAPPPRARSVRSIWGAGGGHVAYAMAPHAGSVVACDLSAAMLEQVEVEAARRSLGNIETTGAAAEALPFADGAFDMLACRFSTHHWRDAPGGLREARRVLQRGAPATFVDVVAPPARLRPIPTCRRSNCCAIPATCAITARRSGSPCWR
ncbi:class I SAM-dependent methyltransferase [Novosphingobium colocasiae]